MRATISLAVVLLAGCATRTLPPPPLPSKEVVVPMPQEPPRPGTGRVLLDVVSEVATVEYVRERTDGYAYVNGTLVIAHNSARTESLCRTPCVLDLPYGSHEVKLTGPGEEWTESDFVVAAPRPSVFRYAPGRSRPRTVAQVLGATGIGIGAPLTIIGGIVMAGQKDSATSAQRNGALAVTAASAGLLAAGVAMLMLFPVEYQPASSLQWELGQ